MSTAPTLAFADALDGPQHLIVAERRSAMLAIPSQQQTGGHFNVNTMAQQVPGQASNPVVALAFGRVAYESADVYLGARAIYQRGQKPIWGVSKFAGAVDVPGVAPAGRVN